MTTKKIMVFRSDWNCLTNIVNGRSQLDNMERLLELPT